MDSYFCSYCYIPSGLLLSDMKDGTFFTCEVSLVLVWFRTGVFMVELKEEEPEPGEFNKLLVNVFEEPLLNPLFFLNLAQKLPGTFYILSKARLPSRL